MIEQMNVRQFQRDILTWYAREKRDLPWRETSNPYYIWVSEVMLQQTRVDTVIPYYLRFIERFPTMEQLAVASEEEILKMWEGLGYYSRVRNLQRGVQQVLEHFGGEVPNTRKEISTLRGVGPYTAGAILSIAFGLPEHAVDGNVMRVYARLFEIEEDIARPKTKKTFEHLVTETIAHEDPSSFNQAIMELGAVVCTPTSPHCLLCPVATHCQANAHGTQLRYPVKTKKTKVRRVNIYPFAIQDEKGRYFMRKRPKEGLLANMWEFPYVEGNERDPQEQLEREYKFRFEAGKKLETYEHIFSHIVWTVYPQLATIRKAYPAVQHEQYGFFTREQIEQLPTAVPVLALLKQLDMQ